MNATAASLLGLISQHGELTGADLVRVAEQRIGEFWSLTRSQVYRELAALHADGLVAPGPAGPRDATPYRLTEAGRTAFESWLAAELPRETIRIPLLLAVAFGGAMAPGRLARILDDAEQAHRARLAHYRALAAELRAAGVDPHARATLSFGLYYEEAVLRWFEDLPPAVRRPRLGAARMRAHTARER